MSPSGPAAAAKTSWEQLLKLIQTSYMDATKKTIEKNAQGGPNYKTTIKINGDVKMISPIRVLMQVTLIGHVIII